MVFYRLTSFFHFMHHLKITSTRFEMHVDTNSKSIISPYRIQLQKLYFRRILLYNLYPVQMHTSTPVHARSCLCKKKSTQSHDAHTHTWETTISPVELAANSLDFENKTINHYKFNNAHMPTRLTIALATSLLYVSHHLPIPPHFYIVYNIASLQLVCHLLTIEKYIVCLYATHSTVGIQRMLFLLVLSAQGIRSTLSLSHTHTTHVPIHNMVLEFGAISKQFDCFNKSKFPGFLSQLSSNLTKKVEIGGKKKKKLQRTGHTGYAITIAVRLKNIYPKPAEKEQIK